MPRVSTAGNPAKRTSCDITRPETPSHSYTCPMHHDFQNDVKHVFCPLLKRLQLLQNLQKINIGLRHHGDATAMAMIVRHSSHEIVDWRDQQDCRTCDGSNLEDAITMLSFFSYYLRRCHLQARTHFYHLCILLWDILLANQSGKRCKSVLDRTCKKCRQRYNQEPLVAAKCQAGASTKKLCMGQHGF